MKWLRLLTLLAGLSCGLSAACSDDDRTGSPPRDVHTPDIATDLRSAPNSRSTIQADLGPPVDLSFMFPDEAVDAPDRSDGDAAAEVDAQPADISGCAPRCAGARQTEYCVGGERISIPCRDGQNCNPVSGECEPAVCEIGAEVCLDETTVEICLDNGTLAHTTDCEPWACVDGVCSEICAESFGFCVDDHTRSVCQSGAFVEEACPESDLGSVCSNGHCGTYCDRAEAASSYEGCVFWAVDLDNIVDREGNGPGAEGVAVFVSNVSDLPATVLVQGPNGVTIDELIIEPGLIHTFELFRRDQVGTRIENAAYRITSSVPVLAYQFNPLNRAGTSSTDASLLLPESAIGDRYRVLTYPGQGANQRGFVTIVATGSEPTTVAFTAADETIAGVDHRDGDRTLASRTIPGQSPADTISRVLEPFDVWQIESEVDTDLSGSLVEADGNVAVFGGTRCSNIPFGAPKCDHLEHQMVPINTWGEAVVATPGPLRASETTTFRVIASEDRTVIETVPPVSGTPTTLRIGEPFTFETTEPVLIRPSSAILVGQFLASSGAEAGGVGDPSFTIVPPVEQYRDDYVFLVPEGYERDEITVIRSRDQPIRLDGLSLDGSIGATFQSIEGTAYEVAFLPVVDGVHRIQSESTFGVLVSGYDDEVSYAYPGGLELIKIGATASDPDSARCPDGGWSDLPCDTGLEGVCSEGVSLCRGVTDCESLFSGTAERCNGLDDDCNGLVDDSEACGDLSFFFISPAYPIQEVTEGETVSFRVGTNYSGPEEVEVAWYFDPTDADDPPDWIGESLRWEILPFEAGVHTVRVTATVGEASIDYNWLFHVHDAPTNFPTLYGRVRDDGVPIRGLQMDLGEYPYGPFQTAFTDFRGYYAYSVSAGEHKLSAAIPRHWIGYTGGRRRLSDGVLVTSRDVRRDLDVSFVALEGSVLSQEDREPIPAARLVLQNTDRDCHSCYLNLTADPDGRYKAVLFAGNQTATVSASHYQRLDESFEMDEDAHRDFLLRPEVPHGDNVDFSLQFRDPCSDRLVEGLHVTLFGPLTVSADTDESGRAIFSTPPGDYRVQINTASYPVEGIGTGIVNVSTTINVPADEGATLDIPNAHIEGEVSYAGAPAQSVDGSQIAFETDTGGCAGCDTTVLATSEGTAPGHYETFLLHSDYELSVSPDEIAEAPSYVISRLLINRCEYRRDVIIHRGHHLSGQVFRLRSTAEGLIDEPASNYLFQLAGPTSEKFRLDEEGRFDFLVAPGEYVLNAGWDSHSWSGGLSGTMPIWRSNGSFIEPHPEPAVTIELEPIHLPMTLIRGQVSNIEGGGGGLSNVALSWTAQSCFRCVENVTTDSEGNYEVILYRSVESDGVFSGRYTVVAEPGEFFPRTTFEGIRVEGREAVVDFNLEDF